MDRIERLQRRSARDRRVISLAGGLPPAGTFPRQRLARGLLRALQGDGALQYGWPEGRERLRTWVSERLRQRGADVSPADVIITSGAQQALAIACRVVCRAGDRIAVDELSYPAALSLFRTSQLELAPLAAATENKRRARALYSMPAISNPQGATLGASERAALLAATERGVHVFEDDAYAELHFDAPPRPLLASTRQSLWHIGTFSKTLCPGLRVGWLIPPREQREKALAVKGVMDLHAGSLAQAILEEYLEHADYDARLVRLRRYYRRRAERLARAVRKELPDLSFVPPRGGFTLWADTPYVVAEPELLALAIRRGVAFDPGSGFRAFPAQPTRFGLRLAFASLPVPDIDEGVRRLASVFRHYTARRRAA